MQRIVSMMACWACCALAPQLPAAAADATREAVLHSFTSGTDGASPQGNLIDVNGVFYGTTVIGGGRNSGVIFALDPTTGAEQVLHSFGDGNDGLNPRGGLIYAKGKLYGTTFSGGGHGEGAVFALDLGTGAEGTVYGFCSQENCTDGQYPEAGLIKMGGVLYGTTSTGGAHQEGTIFSIDLKTGAETVVYSFGGANDGTSPDASLIHVNGVLYGTTEYGGYHGYGTVFSFDPGTGAETVLHSFGSGTDGATPAAGLVDENGTLYGTTWDGGTYDNGSVFSFNLATGAEVVLHSFDTMDGELPGADLIKVRGELYGTTSYGGASGHGTVFSLDPGTGTETVVYSFGGADGSSPAGGLIHVNGRFFGTTSDGGSYGHGTVFRLRTR